jgi:hypothetical protein
VLARPFATATTKPTMASDGTMKSLPRISALACFALLTLGCARGPHDSSIVAHADASIEVGSPAPTLRAVAHDGTVVDLAETGTLPRDEMAVLLRYLGYLVVIVLCSAVAHASFAGTPWRMGGTLVLFSSACMAVTAALGTMFIPHKRTEIVEDFRHFLFQVAILPATGIAAFQWVMRAYTADPRHQDNFLGLLQNSLPMLFAFSVFVPAVVFIKAVAGRRTLDRSQQDDQELMETWTRQDHLMR